MNPTSSPLRFPWLVLGLFIGSGCAALIYEIAWFQMLQLVIGSSAVSIAVLLGTFMGGMCLGSLALPRFVPASRHPLRLYAALELGIAACGLFVLFAVPVIGRIYTEFAGHGLAGILLRAAVAVISLLPPTILMGATLPAIARGVAATPRGFAWLGVFYGGNTLGAVVGCVLAGFYLLRKHDLVVATTVAVAINLLVALLAWILARDSAPVVASQATEQKLLPASTPGSPRPSPTRSVLVAIALSGFCALGAEVVWTRVLSLLLGATVYSFSLILAVFLVGLGLGSTAGARLSRSLRHPRAALGLCQFLQILAIAWAAYAMARSLPYWPVEPAVTTEPWRKLRSDLFRTAWAILPSALLWGASFPLALAALADGGTDRARLVGRTYAANTLGAILGAVCASLLLIPQLGTRGTEALLLGGCVLAGALAMGRNLRAQLLTGFAALVMAGAIGSQLPAIPWQLVAYGRQTATTDYGASARYVGEGMNSTVAVTATADGARYFHVSGKTEASSLPKDMRLQLMLGHIPALLHPQPRTVLVVGCGAGVTAGTFVLHPSVERIVICEIEPLIPRLVAGHFAEENNAVVRDPRVQLVYDDARHFIATTKEKFDVITSDPIHPWVKGSAVLYSQEYFELCRQRLKPGGLVTQWVPLYEADRAVVQSEIATFFAAFPQGSIWGNDDDGAGYDTVLLGHAEPLRVNLDDLQARLDRPDHQRVRAALAGTQLDSAVGLVSSFAGHAAGLRGWLATAEINRDRNLRLQYLAGLQLDSYRGTETYREILGLRRWPEEQFFGSPASVQALRAAFSAERAND